MVQEFAPIHSIKKLTPEIYQLTFHSLVISKKVTPGQFVNIKVDKYYPLLRRPFSVFFVEGEYVSVLFNVIGLGTSLLAKKNIGEMLDVLGPCGNGFTPFVEGNYETAIIIAGGLGVAPFPFLTSFISSRKKIISFVGAKNKNYIVQFGLKNVYIATEDGSVGTKGNVLDIFSEYLKKNDISNSKIFMCGPTRMLTAVTAFVQKKNILCYASLECDMACGIGLCQGCPVEMSEGEKKYRLVCKEGPVFEVNNIILR